MKNIPEKIYLQIGEDPGNDFNELVGVSWSDERINDNDIEFISMPKKNFDKQHKIIEIVANYYSVDNLREPNRTMNVVRARQVAIYLTKKHTDISLTDLGKIMNRTHASIIYAVRKIEGYLEYDKELKKEVEEILTLFNI